MEAIDRLDGRLWDLLIAYLAPAPFTRVFAQHFPPPGAPDENIVRVKSHGYPDNIVEWYLREKLYKENPNVRLSRVSSVPFYWDMATQTAGSPHWTKFIEAVRATGNVGGGITIPVFGPGGRSGYFALSFPKGAPEIPPEGLTNYQWACAVAHLRYCDLIREALPAPPRLSKREKEVLLWLSRGKSNGDIGGILGISVHTVGSNVRAIFTKLGVSDRVSAAIRGVGVSLIHSDPERLE